MSDTANQSWVGGPPPPPPVADAGALVLAVCDTIATGQLDVDDSPTLIVQRGATRVRIANVGAVTVWLGDANVAPLSGFPLAPGRDLLVTASDMQFAAAPAGMVGRVAWQIEQ